jgi:hypothetical protein
LTTLTQDSFTSRERALRGRRRRRRRRRRSKKVLAVQRRKNLRIWTKWKLTAAFQVFSLSLECRWLQGVEGCPLFCDSSPHNQGVQLRVGVKKGRRKRKRRTVMWRT